MSDESDEVKLARIEERVNHMDAVLTKVSDRLEAWDKLTVVIDMNNREFSNTQKRVAAIELSKIEVEKQVASHDSALSGHAVRLSKAFDRVSALESARNRLIGYVAGATAVGSVLGGLLFTMFRSKLGL